VFRIGTEPPVSVNRDSLVMHSDFAAQSTFARTNPVDLELFVTILEAPTNVSVHLEPLVIHILRDVCLYRSVEKIRTALRRLFAFVRMETRGANQSVTTFSAEQTLCVHSEAIKRSANVDLATTETRKILIKDVHPSHHRVDPMRTAKVTITVMELSASHLAKATETVDLQKFVLGTNAAILVILLVPVDSIQCVRWPSTAKAALVHLDLLEMLMLSVSESRFLVKTTTNAVLGTPVPRDSVYWAVDLIRIVL